MSVYHVVKTAFFVTLGQISVQPVGKTLHWLLKETVSKKLIS